MADNFLEQLEEDAENVFSNTSEFAISCTVSPIDDPTATFTAAAADQQLVGAADEKDESNFLFASTQYASPSEGDTITDPDGRVWTVTKTTWRLKMWELQAFAPVAKN